MKPTPRTVSIAGGRLDLVELGADPADEGVDRCSRETLAPSGQAAATTVRRRTTSPGRDVIAASIRNSVGVSSTSTALGARRVLDGVEHQPAGLQPPVRAAAGQRVEPGEHLRDLERLHHVVVGARGEPGQHLVVGAERGEEEHRGVLAGGLEGLDHVAAVGVGEPDVHHDDVERLVGTELSRAPRGRRGRRPPRARPGAARGPAPCGSTPGPRRHRWSARGHPLRSVPAESTPPQSPDEEATWSPHAARAPESPTR